MGKGRKMDAYENLANAIVLSAVDDYKSALKVDNHTRVAKLEKFFLSKYGQLLSYGNGELIINHCKETEKGGEKHD